MNAGSFTGMSAEAAPLWTETFRIRSYETDPDGFASIVSVCNYLQEAAANHAHALGVSVKQLEESDSTWVLARLRVEMDRYPQWRENVVVETWPSGTERLFATRDFLVRLGDGSLVARGTSDWLLIDRKRRRPVRLPEFITGLALPDRERALTGPAVQIPEAGPGADVRKICARYGDMDVNGHVNNVRYIEWAMDPVGPEVLESRRIGRLDVQFKSEAVFGDAVTVAVESVGGDCVDGATESAGGDDEGIAPEPRPGDTVDVAAEHMPGSDLLFAHTIRHADDRRELTRLRSVWRKM